MLHDGGQEALVRGGLDEGVRDALLDLDGVGLDVGRHFSPGRHERGVAEVPADADGWVERGEVADGDHGVDAALCVEHEGALVGALGRLDVVRHRRERVSLVHGALGELREHLRKINVCDYYQNVACDCCCVCDADERDCSHYSDISRVSADQA